MTAAPAMNVSLEQFSARCGGRMSSQAGAVVLTGINHDSRQIQPGDLFVCLTGARCRGEQFLDQARARGASAALVHSDFPGHDGGFGLPLVQVRDTADALRSFALSQGAEFSGVCAAVTGSVGKTTTKDILAGILRCSGAAVTASAGNRNTELGLWLTLSELEPDTDYLVLEMGARRRGDIEVLCQQSPPDLGVVTAIEPVHLQSFADLDEITQTKAELYDALGETAWAVLNADLGQAQTLIEHIRCPRLCLYSVRSDTPDSDQDSLDRARVRAGLPPAQLRIRVLGPPRPGVCVVQIGSASVEVRHRIPGIHNLSNLVSAVAAASALGLAPEVIAAACQHARLPGRRLEHIDMSAGNLLIDDSYNASPGTLLSGIDHALKQRAHLWVVVGELAELGPDEDAVLSTLARQLSSRNFERLICVGAQARALAGSCGDRALCFADSERALHWLLRQEFADTCLYFKASRSAQLDKLVDAYRRDCH